MERNTIDSIISQIRAAQETASGGLSVGRRPDKAEGASFSQLLKSSIDQVNGAQHQAQQMAQAFELGTSDVALHDVMVQMSKANISFQTMVQVRNRLISAYHDMMNMQV